MAKSKTKNEDISFADAFEELEDITKTFEQDEVDLEEGLEKFERGLALASLCQKRLAEVENRVKEIKKEYNLSESSEEE